MRRKVSFNFNHLWGGLPHKVRTWISEIDNKKEVKLLQVLFIHFNLELP
jgi:hypothetical protein